MEEIKWNPFNTDESLVLQSQKISFYKGKPVFKVPGKSGFSFGALFLGGNWGPNDIDLVKHEYGHTFQLAEQGPLGYLIKTVIPSVTGYIARNTGLLAKMNIKYNSLPWEDDANKYGGAAIVYNRYNTTYWDFLKKIFQTIF